MHIRVIFVFMCGLLLLSGCGHVEELRSARSEQATEYNLRAQRAFQRGEYQSAAALYENALLLDVAIENVNGIAVNTLSLARVNQVQGNNALAQRYLDSLLQDKALHYPEAHLAAAATQKSLLRLQEDDVAGATEWIEKAALWCTSGCVLSGTIDNVRAGIAMRGGDPDKALHWSERAASENKDANPLEYANSLRLTAAARLAKNEAGEAARLGDLALGIDKSLGLPEKIRQDLLLLAQAYDKLVQPEQAAQFRDRAARIAATALK